MAASESDRNRQSHNAGDWAATDFTMAIVSGSFVRVALTCDLSVTSITLREGSNLHV